MIRGRSLSLALQIAVPMVVQRLQARGGPTGEDWSRAFALVPGLAARGDVLLHGGGQPGEAAELFNRLAHALAVLSFLPGGLHGVFDLHLTASRSRN